MNSGIALKKIVIILAVKKTKQLGAKFLAENKPTGIDAPFGGFKQSGNGREWGEFGFEEFLEIKAVMGYASK